MRVVLLQDVAGTGKRDDVVEVKDGYARNFLIPKGKAQQATAETEKQIAQRKARVLRHQEQERASQSQLAATLSGTTVVVAARSGEGGRLFGAVTHADVAQALATLGFSVDRHKIVLEPIKHLGDYAATVHLSAGIDAEIRIEVVAK